MISADEYVLQLALDKGLLHPDQITAAEAKVAAHDDVAVDTPTVLEMLHLQHVLAASAVARLLADEFGMEVADLARSEGNLQLLKTVPRDLAVRYQVFPIEKNGGTLRLAISDPLNVDALDSLGHVLKLTIEPLIAPAADIHSAIDRFYGKATADIDKDLSNIEGTTTAADTNDPGGAALPTGAASEETEAPVIRLVHSILTEAIQRRASDIHLEPLEKRFRVRHRIDGVLLEVENPPKRLQLSMISRLKIMANISIAEKRIPQDGRIQVNVAGKPIDLRVSSLPTVHGESIVMRILDPDGLKLGLPELGFLSDDQATFERLITLPDGILLVTGPTGSGKTTTLYSCLHFINKPDRKIITVEDPVEYQLPGINQVPVRHEVGMTFASALRAMLRQAPNIVMVGEIRDLETAEIAINASLTGHMVFSTLHTNDAPGAVTRLANIGVKPFLISTALRAVMAQRLTRKICRHCKKAFSPENRELRSLNLVPSQVTEANFAKGAGCLDCSGSGYRGRMGLFEVFVINEEIQRMIYEGTGTSKLREKARSQGMRTMREDGVRKVLAGMTTIEEVVSITICDVA